MASLTYRGVPVSGSAKRSGASADEFRFGMASRITLLLTMVLGLGLLIVAGWMFNRFSTEIVERKASEMRIETRLQGLRFEDYLRGLERDVRALAEMPPIQGLIRARENDSIDPLDGSSEYEWVSRLETIFLAVAGAEESFFQIRLVGASEGGREIVRVDRGGIGGSLRVVPPEDLQLKGAEPYFRQTVALAPGETTFSDITLNREFGEIAEPHEAMIRVSTPIYDPEGRLFGMLIINAAVNAYLSQLADGQNVQYEYLITNARGDYLYHSEAHRNFGFEFGRTERIQQEYPALADVYEKNADPEVVGRMQTASGDEHLVSINLISYGTEHRHAMGIVVREPYADVLATPGKILREAYALAIPFLLGALLLGYCLANRMVSSLSLTTRAVQRFGLGERDFTFPVNAAGEAGVLARSFDTMARSVVEREQQLEHEVLERTRAQQHVQAILDNAADVIVSIDGRGTILTANRAIESVFGYSPVELVGSNVKVLMPDAVSHKHDSYLNAYAQTGRSRLIGTRREIEGRRKDGSLIQLEIYVSEIINGNDRVFIGILRDITELKRSYERLRSQKHYYEGMIEKLNVPAFVLNPDRTVAIWNRACEELTGFAADEMLGTRSAWRALYEQQCEILPEMIIAGTVEENQNLFEVRPETTQVPGGYRTESWLDLPRTGERKYLAIDSGPVFDENGELTAVIEVLSDITRMKQFQMALEDRQTALEKSNQELEQFAYVASHDLQEPLRMVSSFTQLLSERYAPLLDDTARQYIHFAVDGAQRMQSLIQDLLLLSRVGTDDRPFETVDMCSVCQEVLGTTTLLIDEAGARVSIGDLPVVYGDRTQLTQLLQNLIGNALKYRAMDRALDMHIDCKQDEYEYTFSVCDNGIGISPRFFEKIFVIFQRLHSRESRDGTGIGLSLCKKIVERHGGRIWVESEEGCGATFYFTLPV